MSASVLQRLRQSAWSAPGRGRRRGRLSPLATGILATIVLAIATYFIFGGSAPWSHEYLVRAVLSSATELDDRSPVRIAGVDVGHVTSTQRGPGTTAIVTMALNPSALPLHTDATLKIRPRLFLEGNFFIDLQPGSPAAARLPEGGTIPLAQTAVPVQLDQVLTSLQASPRQDLQQLLHELATIVSDGGAQTINSSIPLLQPAFVESAITAQAAQGEGQRDVAGFIADAERTVRAIDTRRSQLPGLVSDLDRTLTTLAGNRDALGATVAGLDQVAAQAPPTFAALNSVFPTARTVARELTPGLQAAAPTLSLANPVLLQAGRLISPPELPALLGQLDPALPALRTLEPELGTLLSKLQPVTECVRRNALPVLTSSVNDPPLTTGEPIYREFLSGLVGLASATQNFDGDGQALRYHAGFGDQVVSTGKVAGLSESLVGLTSSPVIGSRPRYTGVVPPFRPDVPCSTQSPPSLAAETGPAPPQRRLR